MALIRVKCVSPQYGWSALHYAADAGNDGVLGMLLEFKAEVNLKTNVSLSSWVILINVATLKVLCSHIELPLLVSILLCQERHVVPDTGFDLYQKVSTMPRETSDQWITLLVCEIKLVENSFTLVRLHKNIRF